MPQNPTFIGGCCSLETRHYWNVCGGVSAVSETKQCRTEEVDCWRDCEPDVGRCAAFHGADDVSEHALVGAVPDVRLSVHAVDGARAVGSRGCRRHGANGPHQRTDREEDAVVPGSGTCFCSLVQFVIVTVL